MEKIYLSVIIPAYNEEKRLPKTLLDIHHYLKNQKYGWEIIVISDGSKDKTCEVAENLKKEIPFLKVICERENRGKGYGVKRGMLIAQGEYRLFTDADNSTPINQIEKFFPYLQEGYDVVIGSRDLKGAILDPPQPLNRRFVGEVFKYLRKFVVGLWELEDTQCGFKCFTKRAAEKIFPLCKIERFAFDVEVLLLAKKLGFKIKEVPIFWRNDLQSKVKAKWALKMAFELLKIRLNIFQKKYD